MQSDEEKPDPQSKPPSDKQWVVAGVLAMWPSQLTEKFQVEVLENPYRNHLGTWYVLIRSEYSNIAVRLEDLTEISKDSTEGL
jgi:hypothetical protein